MHTFASLAALAAAVPSVLGAYQGFNYGSTFNDGSVKVQSDFESEFKTAAGLVGTDGGFTSARLYTMIQGGTASDVISAIPAAISTDTTLLLGLWCSAGDAIFANELTALKSAISTYGSSLGSIVAGISVGSEDLYRISVTGLKTSSGLPGVGPDVLVNYIKQVREVISGTALADVPIGHVDTWNDWVNGSNSAVISEVDWLGVDAYPYFQDTESNSISNGKALLDKALTRTQAVAGGRDVWITETGWPVSGDVSGEAVASLDNAKTFWDDAGCPLFGNTNIWWYTLQDTKPTTPNPSFGVVGSTLTTTPLYDLSCSNVTSSSSSSASATASSTKSSTASATGKASNSTAASGSSSSGSGSSGSGSSGSGSFSSKISNSTASSGIPTYTGSSGAGYNSTLTTKASAVYGSSATYTAKTGSTTVAGGAAGSPAGSSATASASASASATAVISGANMASGSIGAAFAIMVAMLAL